MYNVMKHTGKPPKKSSSRPPARRGKGGADTPRTGPESGRNRNRDDRPRRDEPRQSGNRPDQGGKKAFDQKRAPSHAPRSEQRPAREARSREPKSSLGPRANIFGLHAVREAWLNPRRYIHALYLSEQAEVLFGPAMDLASQRGLERPEPRILSKDEFDRLLGRDAVHQGVALSAAPLEEAFIQDIISIGAEKDRAVILVLDQVTDPHNVGAILRSACAFGADGVVMQRRHAPELEGVLAKTASGAVEHLAVAYETNLSRTLETLTDAGYVAIGLDEHAEKSLSSIEIPQKAVLVLGAEGDGMRRLVREHCQVLVTLPTHAPIASLNVSNAAAVALYALLNG